MSAPAGYLPTVLVGFVEATTHGGGEEKDFEFMLKVMRMVQAEQDIRGRTRSLEQMLRSMKLSER